MKSHSERIILRSPLGAFFGIATRKQQTEISRLMRVARKFSAASAWYARSWDVPSDFGATGPHNVGRRGRAASGYVPHDNGQTALLPQHGTD